MWALVWQTGRFLRIVPAAHAIVCATMTLTNREIASLILLLAFFAFALLKDFKGVGSSIVRLVSAALGPRLLLVYVCYLAYATGTIWLAAALGAWTPDLLKDTMITVLIVGFPILAKSIGGREDGRALLRLTLKSVVGLSALLALYVNLESLSLVGELVIQVVAVIATGVAIVAARDGERSRAVVRIANVTMAGVGLTLFAATGIAVASRPWTPEELAALALTVALSVWLPLALIPFAYVAGLIAALETVLVILPFHNGRVRPPTLVRLAIVVGVHARLRYARAIKMQWLGRLARVTRYREARDVMKELRESVRSAI